MEFLGSISTIGWVVICIAFIALLIFLGAHGLRIKAGDKYIGIGGAKRDIIEKEEDDDICHELKKFADNVDQNLHADIIALIEDFDLLINNIATGEKCFFTLLRFSEIIKHELYRRVNYNNLKEHLSVSSRAWYVKDIKKQIAQRYNEFRHTAGLAVCGEMYPDYAVIEGKISMAIDRWADDVVLATTKRLEEKINRYHQTEKEFKTKLHAEKYCVKPRNRNIEYIRALRRTA
jgi:hypothetical protein